MATVFSFPAPARAVMPIAARRAIEARERSDVDLLWFARRLKIAQRPLRAIIATIRLLVENEGCPEPKSPRFVKGRRLRGAAAVWARSTWDRDEAELWFFDDLPPAAAQASAAATQDATRHRLAANARKLAGVGA